MSLSRKILRWPELRGIDKDGHHDSIGRLASQIHQGQMSLMQGTHGGNERDGLVILAVPGAARAKICG
jgi:hypothetical protein